MTDDGFNIGVLYAGSRPVYSGGKVPAKQTVADLEEEFLL